MLSRLQTGVPTGTLVHVVSGSYGAGHDAAARQLVDRLVAIGYQVESFDVADMFPVGVGRLLRAAYLRQLRTAPGTWTWLLRRLHDEAPRRAAIAGLARTVGGHLARAVSANGAEPALVVSTHPFASLALGHLRTTGRLGVPVATYLTDMSVHPLWVHPGVDLYLALHEIPAAQARSRGAGPTVVVGPLAPTLGPSSSAPSGLSGPAKDTLAELLGRRGLPRGSPLVMIVGGSHGIGELERSARDVLTTGLATPVVLCGKNSALHDRLQQVPGVLALGWRDDVPQLMAAVDCVIQNAGGFTSLEALAAGVPTLSYRCLPGHGLTNAAALHSAGWVPWATSPRELATILSTALVRERDRTPLAWDCHARPDVVDALAELLRPRSGNQIPA